MRLRDDGCANTFARVFDAAGTGEKGAMVAPVGLGLLAILAGIALLFVPGIGILGIVLVVVGVLLLAGGFATSRRRTDAPAPRS